VNQVVTIQLMSKIYWLFILGGKKRGVIREKGDMKRAQTKRYKGWGGANLFCKLRKSSKRTPREALREIEKKKQNGNSWG